MPRRPTLHDVASAADVSPRTVSRVVNREGGYSRGTERKVLATIDALGYRPNQAARSLITRRTATVGLVVPTLTDPHFPELAQGVISTARSLGYTIFVGGSDDDTHAQGEILDSLASYGAESAIVVPALGGDVDQLRAAADRGLPLVVIDFQLEHPNVAAICSDIQGGACLATQHLIDVEATPIAMLANARSHPWHWRETGFRETMWRATGTFDERIIHRHEPTLEGGRLATSAVLETMPEVRGIFAYNDLMAVGAIAELREHGRRVPQDVRVVGFDDIPLAEFTAPPLTTVRLDRERVGADAVRAAIDLSLGRAEMPPSAAIGTELVRRQSA